MTMSGMPFCRTTRQRRTNTSCVSYTTIPLKRNMLCLWSFSGCIWGTCRSFRLHTIVTLCIRISYIIQYLFTEGRYTLYTYFWYLPPTFDEKILRRRLINPFRHCWRVDILRINSLGDTEAEMSVYGVSPGRTERASPLRMPTLFL